MTTERERFLPTEQGAQAPNAGRVLALLFAANTFNFYDRAVPAIVAEPIKLEFGLSDLQIGVLAAAFTVVYAVCGLPSGGSPTTARGPGSWAGASWRGAC